MNYWKVTQIKSIIGLPKQYNDTLKRLGLGRIGHTKFHETTPEIAGMIAKVKELVKLEYTDYKLSKAQMKQLRKSNPGFTIEKRV